MESVEATALQTAMLGLARHLLNSLRHDSVVVMLKLCNHSYVAVFVTLFMPRRQIFTSSLGSAWQVKLSTLTALFELFKR